MKFTTFIMLIITSIKFQNILITVKQTLCKLYSHSPSTVPALGNYSSAFRLYRFTYYKYFKLTES